MATHANGIDGQSKYISVSNGTGACWTHAEHYGTLLRLLHHLSETPEEHIKRL